MINVDSTEIAKFDEQNAYWWDKNGPFKSLHDINPLRLNFIETYAPLKQKNVIDIGCGGGILSSAMAKAGAIVTGIDMNTSALEAAQIHARENNLVINYQSITAEAYASEHPENFDIITCLEMLEHVPDPSAIIHACAKLARPNAGLFFSTINRNPKSYLHAIIGAEHLLKLVPKNTHDYGKFIRPSELAKCARAAGLRVVTLTGMNYNLTTQTYYLSDDVSVNYLMYCEKL